MAKFTSLLQLLVLALVVAACAGSASAIPITYVFTGTATGTFGTTSFEGALLTVTATGDTNDVTFDSVNGIVKDSKLSTTITITVGEITTTMTVTPAEGFTDYVFDNQTFHTVGYGVTGITHCCDIIQYTNAAYATYDLKSTIASLSPILDPSTGDWVGVPTSQGALTVTSYTFTFAATTEFPSQTHTLEPGVQAVYSFDNGANVYKITPSPSSTGGEVLTITEVPVLKSNFSPPANFPNETCIPVADYTAQNGADTCVEYQADCSFGGVPGGGDCNTLLYTVLDSFDLPPDLQTTGIGGPDFLVVHGSGCPTSNSAVAVSIFTDYFVTRIDPTIKGGGGGTGSCFIATYTPGAPPIITGTVSRSQFAGWESPVVNGQLNMVKAGSTRPLIFNWNDSSGNPVTNLNYCPNMSGTGCTAPWVNLKYFGVVCPSGTAVNIVTDTTDSAGNSGFQNNGGGNYQLNWKSQKSWKGSCANVEATFDNGLVVVPAVVGFQFN